MDKRFLIIMFIVIAGFIGIFALTSANNGSVDGTPSNHTKGANNKGVELIVYGDFECPACGQFFSVEQQVLAKYGDDIAYTFRHYPIDQIHPNARAAHRAAEAAGKQGKFFEMHDLLYENQFEWNSQATNSPVSIFENYATRLNLNLDQFKADFSAKSTNATINADKDIASGKGITGTPTFYLNDKKLDNNEITSLEGFSAKIDEAIAAQNIQ